MTCLPLHRLQRNNEHTPLVRCSSILWVLLDLDPSRLQSMPPQLCVEGKVLEPRMLGKLAVSRHHQVIEVVAHLDGMLSWGLLVTGASGKGRGEGTGDVALLDQLVDWRATRLRSWNDQLTGWCLLHCLPDGFLLRFFPGNSRNERGCVTGISVFFGR